MDWWLIVLRVVHIGSAMAWFGGAIVGGFFLFPAARSLGPAGQPFMDQLMNGRRMGIYFPLVAALTILAGAARTGVTRMDWRRPGYHRRRGWPSRSAGWQRSSLSSAA